MARSEGEEKGATEVLLLVCMKCGQEVQLEGGEEPPSDLKCEKCGNEVFRRFDDAAGPDEARTEFREETDRDLSTDEAASETERGDVLDLNNP